MTATPVNVDLEFATALSESGLIAARAAASLAGGTAHDSWAHSPFAPAFVRAIGPCKWDISGHRYIDFWMGHGALLLGHGHPVVVEAIVRQAALGTHYGGAHPLQVEWAERIIGLIPSAERVRFTSSGTEASLLALRVARAFTGRPRVVRLDGHFHGWHDEALGHLMPPSTTGLNPGVIQNVCVVSPFSIGDCIEELDQRDVAAVILEPGGGSSGSLPFDVEYLRALRAATASSGTLLIFDEVISGFRYSPGGAQTVAAVRPDLTVLAKILSGGLPGGAVVGRADVMKVFGAGIPGPELRRVVHAGTFNANPLSASAGVTTLDLIAKGDVQSTAANTADRFVEEVNRHAVALEVDVRLYAQSSIFHVLIGAIQGHHCLGPSPAGIALPRRHLEEYALLRRLLLLEGIDSHATHGWVSPVHAEVLDECSARYRRALKRLGERMPRLRLASVAPESRADFCPVARTGAAKTAPAVE